MLPKGGFLYLRRNFKPQLQHTSKASNQVLAEKRLKHPSPDDPYLALGPDRLLAEKASLFLSSICFKASWESMRGLSDLRFLPHFAAACQCQV